MNNKTVWLALFYILNMLIRDSESKNIKKEVECFAQSKIYHPESEKCFKLLTRGPCEPGFWFVLERPKFEDETKGLEPIIRGTCSQEKCPEGDYYWTKTNSCVQQKDKKKLCGHSNDEELLNNYFGEAECVCARDPLRARYEGREKSPCYQLYTRGPCRQKEVIAYAPSNLDKAICIRDVCHEETIRRRKTGTLSEFGVLAPWINGSCYELGTQGPCAETLKFKVHEKSLQPRCITLTNAVFDLEKPSSCFQDENGDCQKRINKVQNADKYKGELLAALISAKKKRSL